MAAQLTPLKVEHDSGVAAVPAGGAGPALERDVGDWLLTVDLPALEDQTRCAVCLGIIKGARLVSGCMHRFCSQCIEKWLRMTKDNSCPQCREPMQSRRDCKRDTRMDRLLRVLYGDDIQEYEEQARVLPGPLADQGAYEPDASVMRDAMRKGEALRAAAEQQRLAARRGPASAPRIPPSPPRPPSRAHDAAAREWRAAAAAALGDGDDSGLGFAEAGGPWTADGGGGAAEPLPYAVVAPPTHVPPVAPAPSSPSKRGGSKSSPAGRPPSAAAATRWPTGNGQAGAAARPAASGDADGASPYPDRVARAAARFSPSASAASTPGVDPEFSPKLSLTPSLKRSAPGSAPGAAPKRQKAQAPETAAGRAGSAGRPGSASAPGLKGLGPGGRSGAGARGKGGKAGAAAAAAAEAAAHVAALTEPQSEREAMKAARGLMADAVAARRAEAALLVPFVQLRLQAMAESTTNDAEPLPDLPIVTCPADTTVGRLRAVVSELLQRGRGRPAIEPWRITFYLVVKEAGPRQLKVPEDGATAAALAAQLVDCTADLVLLYSCIPSGDADNRA